MTFCKRQNYRESKKICGCQGLGVREQMNKLITEDLYASKNILYDIKSSSQVPIEVYTKVSQVLQVIMVYHCRPTNCNKQMAFGRMLMTVEVVHVWWQGIQYSTGKSLVLPAQYCFEHKTALNNKNLKKKLSNDLLYQKKIHF